METKKKKDFDCVEMMHRGAAKARAATKGMTIEEEVAFWAKRSEKTLELQRKLRAKPRMPAVLAVKPKKKRGSIASK